MKNSRNIIAHSLKRTALMGALRCGQTVLGWLLIYSAAAPTPAAAPAQRLVKAAPMCFAWKVV
jgi:hypothetical protein